MDALETEYAALIDTTARPHWPDESIQKWFAGTCGADLLRRSKAFISQLETEGLFLDKNWRGLDYACGFGRFAKLLLGYGGPDQLDMCDAWDPTLNVVNGLGFQNRIFKVGELLQPNDLPDAAYDFVFSFSLFTHLSPYAMQTNIPAVMASLRKNGRFYFTVRHAEFIDHRFEDLRQREALRADLEREGVAHVPSLGNLGSTAVFGETIVTPAYLERFGSIRYLGAPHSLQHTYSLLG